MAFIKINQKQIIIYKLFLPPIKKIKKTVAVALFIFIFSGDNALIGSDRLSRLNMGEFWLKHFVRRITQE